MEMKFFSCIFLLLSLHCYCYNRSEASVQRFVFGDTVVDTGNNNWFHTLAKENILQHGKNFEGGKPNGRFCDGKVNLN